MAFIEYSIVLVWVSRSEEKIFFEYKMRSPGIPPCKLTVKALTIRTFIISLFAGLPSLITLIDHPLIEIPLIVPNGNGCLMVSRVLQPKWMANPAKRQKVINLKR